MVPVPGREVDAHLEAVLVACPSQFGQHIDLAVLVLRPVVGRLSDIVVSQGRGPHGETVVMLGHDDDALHASLLERPHPLFHVHPRGVERLRVSIAITPFLVGKGVQSIMDKGIGLHLLPLHLLWRGQRTDWLGRVLLSEEMEEGRRKKAGQEKDSFHGLFSNLNVYAIGGVLERDPIEGEDL